ncbi:FadR/GntR family transcriptional regulator [Pseudoruegeria sp. HB172150]|uniref:FadR/GntR family transcriptional regulator n=1 Tax=Pseudoruegeria sp. HB172150 TaxID=2721164 RepID=UPI00155321D2|nr:FCD domain-containing protein [Pseudoruegeria sp. HB172150]
MNSQPQLTSDEATAAPIAAALPSDLANLAEKILEVYASDGALPAERILADRLDVKRHTLRRALQALRERDEIPDARPRSPGRRTKARQEDLVNMTSPVEVAELRRMIEPVFAKLAAMRATPSDIAAMQKELEKPGSGDAADIHRLIAQATGNALAAEIYSLLRRIECDARLGSVSGGDEGSRREQQRAIVDAIASRAPDKASEAMTQTLGAIYRQSLYDMD